MPRSDRGQRLAALGIEPYDRSLPRCDECGGDADPAWECRRCCNAPYCDACADEHADICDKRDAAQAAGAVTGDEGRGPEPGP